MWKMSNDACNNLVKQIIVSMTLSPHPFTEIP